MNAMDLDNGRQRMRRMAGSPRALEKAVAGADHVLSIFFFCSPRVS